MNELKYSGKWEISNKDGSMSIVGVINSKKCTINDKCHFN